MIFICFPMISLFFHCMADPILHIAILKPTPLNTNHFKPQCRCAKKKHIIRKCFQSLSQTKIYSAEDPLALSLYEVGSIKTYNVC